MNADTAMYAAKTAGRNAVLHYDSAMNARLLERLDLESDLRHALEREELVLHYQPQIELTTGRIVGAEALVRWQHPEKGLLFPDTFIPLAEETGLIDGLGSWVLNEACRQTKNWQIAGLSSLKISVNLSFRQFRNPDLIKTISDALTDARLESKYLELELTESVVMNNLHSALAVLMKLKAMGIFLSMDDFGTGYSSLSYLKKLPLDTLKIDKSFVMDIQGDNESARLVAAIIAMAKSLQINVVAEGVETSAQRAFLIENDVALGQGFLFSRAVDVDTFASLLKRQTLPSDTVTEVP